MCLLFPTNITIFTSFTAPELDVHIALVLAKPTVDPSKSTPLREDEETHSHDGSRVTSSPEQLT